VKVLHWILKAPAYQVIFLKRTYTVLVKKIIFTFDRTSADESTFKPRHKAEFSNLKDVKFNFDEFYRAHYGEALKRQRQEKKEYEEESFRATFYQVPIAVQQAWVVGTAMVVVLLGAFVYKGEFTS